MFPQSFLIVYSKSESSQEFSTCAQTIIEQKRC